MNKNGKGGNDGVWPTFVNICLAKWLMSKMFPIWVKNEPTTLVLCGAMSQWL